MHTGMYSETNLSSTHMCFSCLFPFSSSFSILLDDRHRARTRSYIEGLHQQVVSRETFAGKLDKQEGRPEARGNIMDTGLGFGSGHGNSYCSSSTSSSSSPSETSEKESKRILCKQALDQQLHHSRQRAVADAAEFVNCSIPFDPFYERSIKAREAKDAATRKSRVEFESSMRNDWRKQQQAFQAARVEKSKQAALNDSHGALSPISKREKQLKYKQGLDKQVCL